MRFLKDFFTEYIGPYLMRVLKWWVPFLVQSILIMFAAFIQIPIMFAVPDIFSVFPLVVHILIDVLLGTMFVFSVLYIYKMKWYI